MTTTVTQTTGRTRHLAAVGGRHAAIRPQPAPVAERKPVLALHARLNVEQARKYLLDLDTAAASGSPLLAMYLLGRCAEHLQAVLDVVDAATEMPR